MPIRKGRLGKVCIRCGKTFIPDGICNRICPDCCIVKRNNNINRWFDLQNKTKKK